MIEIRMVYFSCTGIIQYYSVYVYTNLPMILSKKKAVSSFGLTKTLLHSTIAMSRSLLNDTIVRLGVCVPPVSRKEGPPQGRN